MIFRLRDDHGNVCYYSFLIGDNVICDDGNTKTQHINNELCRLEPGKYRDHDHEHIANDAHVESLIPGFTKDYPVE
ncbi:hypothetical protein TNIN_397351 [Trichonephila inaurata madagascariensis]|uniref:Uncharacterized protein n=1 Tax=Trichonephila inaurata madagascariensis TaxID=2747483 RepID=A0A8X6JR54_9ARAC|nr:hypothetical protein TNIN_397351 [Trichonephila inaurata madagascariensis]